MCPRFSSRFFPEYSGGKDEPCEAFLLFHCFSLWREPMRQARLALRLFLLAAVASLCGFSWLPGIAGVSCPGSEHSYVRPIDSFPPAAFSAVDVPFFLPHKKNDAKALAGREPGASPTALCTRSDFRSLISYNSSANSQKKKQPSLSAQKQYNFADPLYIVGRNSFLSPRPAKSSPHEQFPYTPRSPCSSSTV